MFTWSARRRLIYLLLTVLVLAAVGGGLYWYYKPAPSCFDGIQNGDELGVDCGGSCPQVCPSEVQDPRIVWTRVFKVDEGNYDTATLIENPNPHHGVKSVPYLIRVLDQNNILITTLTGETFLNPQEQFVVFHSRLAVGNRVPARAIFEFSDTPVWQKITQAAPSLTVAEQNFSNQPRPQLLAQITNNSLRALSNIEVVAVLSDQNGNALAVSSTVVDTLDAGQTKPLAFVWPKPLAQAPTNIDLYPHLNWNQLNNG